MTSRYMHHRQTSTARASPIAPTTVTTSSHASKPSSFIISSSCKAYPAAINIPGARRLLLGCVKACKIYTLAATGLAPDSK